MTILRVGKPVVDCKCAKGIAHFAHGEVKLNHLHVLGIFFLPRSLRWNLGIRFIQSVFRIPRDAEGSSPGGVNPRRSILRRGRSRQYRQRQGDDPALCRFAQPTGTTRMIDSGLNEEGRKTQQALARCGRSNDMFWEIRRLEDKIWNSGRFPSRYRASHSSRQRCPVYLGALPACQSLPGSRETG